MGLFDNTEKLDLRAKEANKLGNHYVEICDLDSALSEFSKAIKLNPEFADPYLNRAFIYYTNDQWQPAIDDCTKAIELDPQRTRAFNLRARNYVILKQYDEAMSDFNRAIELAPKDAEAYRGRGNLYLMRNKLFHAFDDFWKFISLSKDRPEIEEVRLQIESLKLKDDLNR